MEHQSMQSISRVMFESSAHAVGIRMLAELRQGSIYGRLQREHERANSQTDGARERQSARVCVHDANRPAPSLSHRLQLPRLAAAYDGSYTTHPRLQSSRRLLLLLLLLLPRSRGDERRCWW
jgi:hypothetical protein